jgi:membrane-bound ClpP family serine protease
MLQKIPKNKDKIAVIVNSQGGCLAQTNIIIQKINQIAKRNKAQVWTFGQEWALNAGFLLLTSADRVFIDRSTVVGGLEVGESKLLRGKLGKYLDTVTYSTAPSYLSEANSSESINPTKKEEI